MQDNRQDWKTTFYQSILGTPFESWIATLMPQLTQWEANKQAPDVKRWSKQVQQLPDIDIGELHFSDQVAITSKAPISEGLTQRLNAILKQFMPWRKGPFSLFGIEIDTEWRSDYKWDRVLPHIQNLQGRTVLDVGCGSGYHLFRMHGAGAAQVVGIDPTVLFFYQFQIFKRYAPHINVHYLPLGIEHMPAQNHFDTVFSMGVLYHRRDPIEFLSQLKSQLRSGGQLVLETLVIDGDAQQVLVPGERYAQMRNVWFIPSCEALVQWLERLQFADVKVVDINQTSIDEQRSTQWMDNHSLQDFLNPQNPNLTIEGYPAPKRAVIVATKK